MLKNHIHTNGYDAPLKNNQWLEIVLIIVIMQYTRMAYIKDYYDLENEDPTYKGYGWNFI